MHRRTAGRLSAPSSLTLPLRASDHRAARSAPRRFAPAMLARSLTGAQLLRHLRLIGQVETLAPQRIVEIRLRIGQRRAQEPLVRLLMPLAERPFGGQPEDRLGLTRID